MSMSEIDKVLTVIRGIGSGDVHLATRYMNPDRYEEHNPYAADGGV